MDVARDSEIARVACRYFLTILFLVGSISKIQQRYRRDTKPAIQIVAPVVCVIANLNVALRTSRDREFAALYVQSAAIFIAEVYYGK